MEKLNTKQRMALIEFLKNKINTHRTELEFYKTMPEKFGALWVLNFGIPSMELQTKLIDEISRLLKLVELMENPAVESMNDDEFKKYIGG